MNPPALPLKLLFFGTPEFALPSLQILIDSGHTPLLVITQLDKIRGRGTAPSPTPVNLLAQKYQIPVITPENVNAPEALALFQQHQPDLFLTVAYGQIFRNAFLAIPRLGTLNVHASLLPTYRGSAPYQWALLRGEKQTGITIIEVVRKLDAGAMLKQSVLPIFPQDTGDSLAERLATLGGKLLLETVIDYEAGTVQKKAQNESDASQYNRFVKEDGLLQWNHSATELERFIRGMQPWPKAQTSSPEHPTKEVLLLDSRVVSKQGKPGEILQFDKQGILIACGKDTLEILRLQVAGKKAMDAKAFVNGNHWHIGQFLGKQDDC
ncbi:MAG: methionyl-tRNA formyltransferase [Planctomycetota bacterium]